MPLFFQFKQILGSRAEIHQIFALLFGKFKASQRHSEINRPLHNHHSTFLMTLFMLINLPIVSTQVSLKFET